MDLNMVLGIAAVLAGWIMLSLMGNERWRRVREIEAAAPPVPAVPAAPAIPTSTNPQGAKARHWERVAAIRWSGATRSTALPPAWGLVN